METGNMDNSRYETWPEDYESCILQARELFGRFLTAVYDNRINHCSDLLFNGYRPKSPSQVQIHYLNNLVKLDNECKNAVLEVVKETVSSTIFQILGMIDGTKGHILTNDFREQIRIHIQIWRLLDLYENDKQPIADIEINSDKFEFLHEQWYRWVEQYSTQANTRE